MKRFLALAALVLGVVSCQTEPEGFDVIVGGEQEVMVNVALPEGTRASSADGFDLNTLATTDYSLRYILEIYLKNDAGEVLYDKCQRHVKVSDDTSVAFPVRLAQGRDYQVTVWADIVEGGSEADRYYYTADGLDAISIITWNAMDETRDAYTGSQSIDDFSSATPIDLILKRPFAKVRVVATDIDDIRAVGLEPTKAVVEYQDMYHNFNAVSGVASEAADKSHNYAYATTATKYTDVSGEMTLFADYIFVPQSGTVQFTLDVMDQADRSIKFNNFNTAIYVEANKLTTIKGDVLTVGGNVKVTVDNELGVKDVINIVDTPNSLIDAIEDAQPGEETNIELGGDIDLGDLFGTGILSTRATAALPIVIPEGKTLVLDLNGFNITAPFVEGSTTKHFYAFDNKGEFTIKDTKGGGKIISRGNYNYGTMTLESGELVACDGDGGYAVKQCAGEFVMNGGSIYTSLEDDNQVDNGGYDATTLRIDEGATATINGGTINNICDFTSAIDNRGELVINGGNITSIHTTIYSTASVIINDATVTCNGLAGVTTHTIYTVGTGKVTINGGTFAHTAVDQNATGASVINGNVEVNAGTFSGRIENYYGTPVLKGGNYSEKPADKYIDDDYTAVEAENGRWNVVRKPDVAKIGEVGYTSLAKAVAAIQDGETITLVANEVFTENNYYDNGGWKDGLGYAGDKSFTIDLGGNTVSQNGALNDYLLWFKNVGSKANTITIKNGTLDAGTTAFCALCTASSHENELTINLENITLINKNSNGSTIKVRAGSTLNVKAGTKIIGQDSYLGIENWNATVNVYEGAEIYMNGTTSYNGCLIGVGGNGVVNVYGGYGKGVSGGLIAMTSGGTINVNGGEWIANTDGAYANSNKSVLIAQSDKQYNAGAGNAVVNVTGGTFKGGYNCYGNAVGDAQINITGGNFNSNPANYVVAGYEVNEENGIYTVRKPQALVDFEAAIAQGGDVTLTDDITLSETVVIEEGKTVNLNLNGKTITGAFAKGSGAIIENNGTLTIVGGTIKNTEINGDAVINNTGELVLEDVNIEGAPIGTTGYPSYAVYTYGKLTVENETQIISDRGALYMSGNADVTINGGEFVVTNNIGTRTLTAHVIYAYSYSSKLTINDGNFEMNIGNGGGTSVICPAGATINVYGGNFYHVPVTDAQSGCFQNYMGYGAPVDVYGGTFNDNTVTKSGNLATGYKAVEENGLWIVVAE
ncbi:MAG: hypothetical protein J6V59_02945 [Alistipes sp.]|nr:hypothetical protein [Alistipes sp.]